MVVVAAGGSKALVRSEEGKNKVHHHLEVIRSKAALHSVTQSSHKINPRHLAVPSHQVARLGLLSHQVVHSVVHPSNLAVHLEIKDNRKVQVLHSEVHLQRLLSEVHLLPPKGRTAVLPLLVALEVHLRGPKELTVVLLPLALEILPIQALGLTIRKKKIKAFSRHFLVLVLDHLRIRRMITRNKDFRHLVSKIHHSNKESNLHHLSVESPASNHLHHSDLKRVHFQESNLHLHLVESLASNLRLHLVLRQARLQGSNLHLPLAGVEYLENNLHLPLVVAR